MFCSKIERSNFKAKHGEWKCYVSPRNKRLIGLNSEGNKILLGKMDTWADASRQYPLAHGPGALPTTRAREERPFPLRAHPFDLWIASRSLAMTASAPYHRVPC